MNDERGKEKEHARREGRAEKGRGMKEVRGGWRKAERERERNRETVRRRDRER